MEILLLLIPVSVLLVLGIGAVFWWSVRSGQFDDLDGPAHRILTDDDGWVPDAQARTGPDEQIPRPDDLTSIKPDRDPPR